jgi:hypothetical protein
VSEPDMPSNDSGAEGSASEGMGETES